MATKAMDESWERIQSQIEVLWGKFDEKDMKKARGSLRQMVDLIHDKTGEDPNVITQKIGTMI